MTSTFYGDTDRQTDERVLVLQTDTRHAKKYNGLEKVAQILPMTNWPCFVSQTCHCQYSFKTD